MKSMYVSGSLKSSEEGVGKEEQRGEVGFWESIGCCKDTGARNVRRAW